MARGNGKTINVKIPTVKVINALETKLTQIKTNYAKQDELENKYKKTTLVLNENQLQQLTEQLINYQKGRQQ